MEAAAEIQEMREEDPDPPVAIMIDADIVHEGDWPPDVGLLNGALRGRNVDSISNFLFEMIRNGCTCNSVLSGWVRGCTRTVCHCNNFPDQAFFTSHMGRTPLHEACLRNSCRHVIKALLHANPISATERDNAGNTPLHLLFSEYSYRSVNPEEIDEIVGDLLAINPSFLAASVNGDGHTALHMACCAPESMIQPSILRRLLAANPVCASTLDASSTTALSLYCRQVHASPGVAQILLDAYPEAVHHTQRGCTPLHDAANNSNTELIRFLVTRVPEAANVRGGNVHGDTPLHLICQQKPRDIHIPALQALLQAAPHAISTSNDRNLYTPLHILCKYPRVSLQVLKLLSNPMVAAMCDSDHYTPLHHACENGADVEIIRYLLTVCREAAGAVTRKHDTALHLACGTNVSSDIVRLLIEANPTALTMTNDYGFTPLHGVCRAYQPRMGVVQALVSACPQCVTMRTHGGETPLHLACSSGAFVGVLQLLTSVQTSVGEKSAELQEVEMTRAEKAMTNKVGNTPLHEACFRGSSFEHIETLSRAKPHWIVIRNNAGYTPLQMLCKGGRLDERIVKTFSRIRGPEVFSVMDSTGHTPLHSASREGTSVAAIQSLIRAFPDALSMKTTYGDTPLHLACFRGANVEVVKQIAEASSDGRHSPVLEPNTAGQTPIGIAMEAFQQVSKGTCCTTTRPNRIDQVRAFGVLAALVKILFYGASHQENELRPASLVRACVCLHRQDVRLDPVFLRCAIHHFPEEVRMRDEQGNYPLHIEASIPVEKMLLLDSQVKVCSCGKCHARMGILGMLLDAYPEATRVRNSNDEFAIGLMIQNGRLWDHTFSLALRNFPPALHWYKGANDALIAMILANVSKECGADTLFELITARPDMVRRRPSNGI